MSYLQKMGFCFLIMQLCNKKKSPGGTLIGGFLVLLKKCSYLDLIKITGDLSAMKYSGIVNYIRKFPNSSP